MDSEIQKLRDTVEVLRQENKANNKDLRKAAMFGNQLLEDNNNLNLKLEHLQSQVDTLQQEKYSLQLDLETEIQTARSLTSDLEIQVEEVERLNKKLATAKEETAAHKIKYNSVLREKSDLENVVEDLKLQNSSQKDKIKSLEQQIETLRETTLYSSNESKTEENHPDVTLYITKNKELEDALIQTTYDLESTKLKESRLLTLVKELEEAIADKDTELSSYSIEMQSAKEFSAELQCEIEVLKLGQVDVNRRGNSMFGELDDRRRLVEKEYKLLSQKYDNVTKNYESNKGELARCKGQMTILLSMASKKYQDEYIEKLESMNSSLRRENEDLTSQFHKAVKRNQQQTESQITSAEKDKYDYLRVMNQQSQKKIKELENDMLNLRMMLNEKENLLYQTDKSLCKTKKECNDLEIEVMKLKQQIKEQDTKPDSDVPETPKSKIQLMSGFEETTANLKLLQRVKNDATEAKENDIIPGHLLMSEKGFVEVSHPRLTNKAKLERFNPLKKDIETDFPLNNSTLREINNMHEQGLKCMTANDESNYPSHAKKKQVQCAQQ